MRIIRAVWHLSVLVIIAACVFASGLILSGVATAHPYDAPQIGDFVPRTFNCTGDVAPWGVRYVEFSGTWQGNDDAQLEFVEFTFNEQGPLGGKNLQVGVDDKKYDGQNIAPLRGTHGDKMLRQNVVFHLEPVRPDQEFGIYAQWVRPDNAKQSDRVLLARWKGNERFKCGEPLFG